MSAYIHISICIYIYTHTYLFGGYQLRIHPTAQIAPTTPKRDHLRLAGRGARTRGRGAGAGRISGPAGTRLGRNFKRVSQLSASIRAL